MKKYSFISALALLTMISCQKENIDSTEKNAAELSGTVELCEMEGQEFSKTQMGTGRIIAWKTTDCISVLSNGANDEFAVKSVNPSNPSQVTFTGKLSSGKSEYIAFYPYSGTASYDGTDIHFSLPQTQTYAADNFADGSFPTAAVFSDPSEFLSFRNLCGILKLTLKGSVKVDKIALQDNSGKSLWGNVSLKVDEKLGTLMQDMRIENGGNTIVLDCSGSSVNLTPSGVDFYFVVPSGSFKGGLQALVYSGGKAYSYHPSWKNNNVSRSKILAMPAVEASSPSSFDLSADGARSANCYIVPAKGSYKFLATKGNSSTAVTPASVGVLWETAGTTTAPSRGGIISSVSYSGGYVNFTASGTKGNAVIAAFSGAGCTGDILWSWHIWSACDYINSSVFPVASGVCMMDRNIGAFGYRKADGALAAGLLYQWGRKDPLTGAATVTAPGQRTTPPERQATTFMSGYSFNSVSNSTASNGTLAYAVKHPTTFVSCADGFNDNDWLIGHDASLWIPSKTMYDPCPAGYRVPDQGLKGVWDADKCVFDAAGRGYTFYGTQWMVESGYVYRADGTFCGGYDGMFEIWACSKDAVNSYYIGLHAEKNLISSGMTTAKKSNAYGVRCCVDR